MLDLQIPDAPFLAILGTSHTAGDCDDGVSTQVEHTYGKLLADKMGLEYVNLGMSGASNFDLLEIANELTAYDLLKNCKMFLLEPRLGGGTMNISRDPLLEYYNNDIFQDYDHIYPSLLMTEHFSDIAEKYMPTVSYGYFSIWNGSDLSDARVRDRISGGYADNIKHVSNTEFSEFTKYLKQKVYYEAGTCYNRIHDLTVIQSIKNIVGVSNFGWLNFSGAPAHHPLIEDIYKYNLPYGELPEDATNRRNLSIITYITENYSAEFINQNECRCGHFNQKVHQLIADILYERIDERKNY